jgi:predicted transcriptional regulator
MESLSHTFSMKALLILLKVGRRMTVPDIASEMREQHGSVVHAITALREANLLEAFERRGAPYEEEVFLTQKGRIVAEKLKEIEDTIGWMGRGGVT